MTFLARFNYYYKRKSVRYGVPFLVLILGGSFGLQQFTSIRYQFSKKQAVKPEDFEDLGITVKKPGEVTLETEFEKVKTIDIDNWENIRGPRPWEEGQPQVASH